MNAMCLSSYSAVWWRPGKTGFMNVVGTISLTEVPKQKSLVKGAVVAAPIALKCVKQPEQDFVVWLGWKGSRNFKKSGKGLHKVLYVCTTATHSGVFFAHHRGKRLGFALIAHDSRNPQKLSSKPTLYKKELSGLMADVLHDGERTKTTTKEGQLVTVRQAVLRQTLEGHVLAAVFVNQRGDVYAVVAHLAKNTWRKWRMEAAVGSMPCIHVPEGGRDVRFVHCDIDAPVDHTSAVVAPSLPLALSTFDRISASSANLSAQVSATVPPLLCVTVREVILPTRGSGVAAVRVFQSQCVERVSGDVRVMPQPCLTHVDEATAVYTVVVLGEQSSCLLHMRHSMFGSELMTSCATVAGLHRPISACTLSIPSPHRPQGARVSLVLSDDMRVYCCEHFGQVVSVSLSIDGADCSMLMLPVPLAKKSSKKMTTAITLPARLIPVNNETEVLCTNGTVGLFLRVTSAAFSEAVPAPPDLAVEGGTGETAGRGMAGEAEVGAAALRLCLQSLQQLSVRAYHHDLPDVFFRHILPHLRYVGTSQQEVMLIQRVYEQLLQMAEPIREPEWSYLWALTSLLQKALVKRGRENQLRYTDAFFLQLADTYRQSSFASPSGAALVGDGVRAVVSTEVQDVIAAPTATVPAEAMYVLDGLAAGVAPVALAEEIVRRMVNTETLSNGTCVVASQAGVADCVHCMGCVLVASCLDLSVFVIADEVRGLRVSLQRPQVGVCVAIQPHTFASQKEFETALGLAGDLLCVSSADASFRPDVALLTLGIGGRQHCLNAFLQLFSPVLRHAVDALTPLSSNRTWFEECVATLTQSTTEWVASLLRKGGSDSFTLTATLCHMLCAAQRGVDAAFFRSLSHTLSEEFCTTALVTILFHQTELLLAAIQNYASAVAACISTKNSEAEKGANWQATDVGRIRLQAALAQTSALWAQIDSLSPYRVRDVAESYRISASISLASAARAASASTEGTMVSRTLVLCFRILCLVQYSMAAEEDTSLSVSAESASWTTSDAAVRDCQGVLETLYLIKGGPLPLEWFQWKFMSSVRRAAAIKPTWAPYLVRLMQLSNVHESSSAALKRDFYTLLDTLQSRGASSTTTAEEGDMQRAVTAAESAVGALAGQAEHRDAAAGAEGRSPALSMSTAFFIFSRQRDASLPDWSRLYSLPERRHLFAATWVDALWTLERIPDALDRACAAALARVQLAASEVGTTGQGGDQPPALSEELALPLYAHIYRLRPPVRMHAVIDATPAESDGAYLCVQQRVDRAQQHEEAPREAIATPENATAKPQHEDAQVAVAPAVDTATSAPLPSLSAEPEAAVRTGTSEAMPTEQASSAADAGAAAAAAASAAVAAPAAPAVPTRSGLYSPTSVAWWDTLETTPSRPRALDVKVECATANSTSPATADDNGESSDSATTYTTSASNYVDPVATLESFHRCCYARGGSQTAAESVGSSWSDSEWHLCKHRYAAARSQAQHRARKRCRCCGRAMRVDYRGRSAGRRGEAADDTTPVRVQWSGTAKETTAPYVRSPLVTAKVPTAAAARPALLGFSARLQPPEEPATLRAQPARMSLAAPSPKATPFSLLTFPFASKGQQASRVRLYTLDGDRVRYVDGQGTVPLQTTSRPGVGALLNVPPLPATSVFPACRPLVRLPSQPAPAQLEHRDTRVPCAAEAAQPVRFVEVGHAYPQVPRPPAGVAPPAVDAATLQATATSAPVPVRAAEAIAFPSVGVATPVATTSAPPAPATVTPLPAPTALPIRAPAVLSPAQMSDFRRYTDNLLARQTGSTPLHAVTTASVPAAAPPTADRPSTAPAVTTAVDSARIARLIQQQEEFLRKAEAIMEKCRAEKDGFYRRVEETLCSVTAASQQRHGLSPVEQAQLVQNNIKQRNELLALNHQLLERPLAAARAGGEEPPVPTVCSATSQAAPPGVTATGATQTPPQLRESVGVPWAATGGSAASTAAAAAFQQRHGLSPVEQAQLVQNNIKQRNELLALNHQLLELQLAAARAGGEEPPVPTVCSATSQAAPPGVTATGATQTPPQLRESVGVPWAATGGSAASTAAAAAAPVPPSAISVREREGMKDILSDLQRLNAELMASSASAEAMDRAVKETREVIERYERNKTAEALTAEGIALISAMRQRTAAIERQLAELPQRFEEKAATDAKKSSSVWASQLSAANTVEGSPADAPPAAPLASFTSTTAVVPPSSLHFTAQAGTSAGSAEEALLSRDLTQHLPSSNPLGAVSLSTSMPQTAKPPQPGRAPGPTASVLTAPVVSYATPRASSMFTSVSSVPIDEPTVLRSATPKGAFPPSASFHAERAAGGEVPSLHVCETVECTTVDPPRDMPSNVSAPRVATQLGDLGSLFVESGGRYETRRNASAAPSHTRAAASPRRRVPVRSPAPKPHAGQRRFSSPAQAPGRCHRKHEERYAMYRATSRPAKVRPAATATPYVPAPGVPFTPAPRVSIGNVFVDRQQSRLMASIAKRMQQLEQDLFT
ncbi:conserved hypothetical protein [Leishmania major strain Friedlin]|uniref:Uncharacterized protein n=1 Tax=Leishmania major TaxID=5664 RepID=O97002_LEIMA|nr:conserved hypothetical protein [Leishmania major strain Friedlin]CAC22662.1 conserved hypothetical protein [Leishmania major strain Friedlin]CAG9567853.1 hypothetical_protein_-_conserved [Leishmania major strain Friedlin]|eukprot:XP_888629.1 conserved hypothetical protein [Leishmania major strain Friedlin]